MFFWIPPCTLHPLCSFRPFSPYLSLCHVVLFPEFFFFHDHACIPPSRPPVLTYEYCFLDHLAQRPYPRTKKYVLMYGKSRCKQPGGVELGPLTKPYDPAECARRVESNAACVNSLVYWVKDKTCVCMQQGKGNEECTSRSEDKLAMVYKFLPGRVFGTPDIPNKIRANQQSASLACVQIWEMNPTNIAQRREGSPSILSSYWASKWPWGRKAILHV